MCIRRNSRAVCCGYFIGPAFGLRLPCIDERYKTGRRLHRVTNGLVFVTEINGRALMTDYSGAIFALVAITSVLTAAVVFVLAQPTDLPVIKKIQG